MTVVLDGKWTVLLRNIYRNGRVSEQRLANGDVYRYDYKFVKNEIVETIVRGPTWKRTFFFENGVLARDE
jgi:hypothetical protein